MADRESNLQLAKLWVILEEIRNRIDNEAVPLGMHLSLEDPELMQTLETLSGRIEKHFGRGRLVAEPRKKKKSVSVQCRDHVRGASKSPSFSSLP